jgi:antitoxin (DNA-binding transcriptional repressor) of toxin-antitoxin stability system
MYGTIAVTDYGWCESLLHRELQEVNSWTPSDRRAFYAPGFSPFLFKLKAPHNAICASATILAGRAETRSVTEVARHFADYINRVIDRGERFVLVRGNKPVAELGPLPVRKRLVELPDLLASLPNYPRSRQQSSPTTSHLRDPTDGGRSAHWSA